MPTIGGRAGFAGTAVMYCRQGHLPVLDENCLEHVGGVFTRVDGFLELFVDVLPADHSDRILAGGEELRYGGAVEPVAFVLEIAERVQLAARVLESLQAANRFVQLLGATQDHLCLLLRLRPDLLDSVPDDVPRSLVDVIADVVDRTRQEIDVVTVERRYERAIEEVDDLAREAVALVLQLLDLP